MSSRLENKNRLITSDLKGSIKGSRRESLSNSGAKDQVVLHNRRKAQSNWDLKIIKDFQSNEDAIGVKVEEVKTYTPKSPKKIEKSTFAKHIDLTTSTFINDDIDLKKLSREIEDKPLLAIDVKISE